MLASTSFSGRGRQARSAIPAIALLAMLGACSTAGHRIERDPYQEAFFEKARLIMTSEEIQIYRHLPDEQAKREFIVEFWEKRDPVPETEENENKVEFERRIAFANRWFRENRPSGRGWNTPRGRILLLLGEPDNRLLNNMTNSSNVKVTERWIYDVYQLDLTFVDRIGLGEYELQNWPPELLSAMDQAKLSLLPSRGVSPGKALVLTARFSEGRVVIAIPLKRVRFSEDGDSIRAGFKVTLTAYRDFVKVATHTFSKQLAYPKDGVPTDKQISFSLPFPLQAKGKYHIEVLLQDVLTGSRARDFIGFKL